MSILKLDVQDIPQKLKDASKTFKAMPKESTEVKIILDLTKGCYSDYCFEEFLSIHSEVGSTMEDVEQGTNPRFPVTYDTFLKYCTTFVASRVGYCSSEFALRIVTPNDNVAIPAFLAVALKMIGNVDDDANAMYYSVKLEYGASADAKTWAAEHCLDLEETLKIARYLRRIQTYHYGMNLPKDKTGRLDLVKIGIIDTKIWTYDPTVAPALTLPAALLGQLYSLSDYYSARFYYGDLTMIGGKVCDLTSIQW